MIIGVLLPSGGLGIICIFSEATVSTRTQPDEAFVRVGNSDTAMGFEDLKNTGERARGGKT